MLLRLIVPRPGMPDRIAARPPFEHPVNHRSLPEKHESCTPLAR
jgi:hypothetical protein